ncbi:hypothetical protein AB6A40_005701 [Gnathostoma spinigerum]|uniref:Uncharacterized protein n=1 Tax=Gnathostoma spinigerum TaxID=75299 RepID=A0ABD6EQM5_9BILA
MSFLKMFRSKKGSGKENEDPTAEIKNIWRRSAQEKGASMRREKPSARFSVDDNFLKPTAPYHTVTQPKQHKGTRSCVGRDEYDRYRPEHDRELKERNSSKYGRRLYNIEECHGDVTAMRIRTYDAELIDSDDSFDCESRRTQSVKDDQIQVLESRLESAIRRIRKEEEKKNAYKQKLMSERLIRQHIEAKFIDDIQRLSKLVETLKNEQKMYRNKLSSLQAQLKETSILPAIGPSHFTTGSLFCSPPSTSNEQSSIMGAGETLCNGSNSTVPIENTFHCNSPIDGLDEVKNFRIKEDHSPIEAARKKASDNSSISSVASNADSNETLDESYLTLCQKPMTKKKLKLRRSLSDGVLRTSNVIKTSGP